MLDNDKDEIGCRSCKLGYVGNIETGGTQCQHCAAGEFANRIGAELYLKQGAGYTESCDQCQSGKYSLISKDECSICSHGYRTLDEMGSADCIACPAGKNQLTHLRINANRARRANFQSLRAANVLIVRRERIQTNPIPWRVNCAMPANVPILQNA